MKRFLAPIFLVVLLFPSLALGEEMKDLVKREGLYYKKFTDVPFTGKVTGKEQGSLKNGKKHGPWVSYHKNGQLHFKGDYKNGKRVGPYVSYYENGQLSSKGTYKNGVREGRWVDYKEDGTVDAKFTGTFKNGKKISD